jgi:hypothetical protein
MARCFISIHRSEQGQPIPWPGNLPRPSAAGRAGDYRLWHVRALGIGPANSGGRGTNANCPPVSEPNLPLLMCARAGLLPVTGNIGSDISFRSVERPLPASAEDQCGYRGPDSERLSQRKVSRSSGEHELADRHWESEPRIGSHYPFTGGDAEQLPSVFPTAGRVVPWLWSYGASSMDATSSDVLGMEKN